MEFDVLIEIPRGDRGIRERLKEKQYAGPFGEYGDQ
jgi:hypothetical protein